MRDNWLLEPTAPGSVRFFLGRTAQNLAATLADLEVVAFPQKSADWSSAEIMRPVTI